MCRRLYLDYGRGKEEQIVVKLLANPDNNGDIRGLSGKSPAIVNITRMVCTTSM